MSQLKVSHIANIVTDIDKARAFYGGLLGLDEIPRPAFAIPGIWYQLGEMELHLTVVKDKPKNTHHPQNETVQTHFALMLEKEAFEDMHHLLKSNGARLIGDIEVSPTGIKQLFVYDPDGNMIELCMVCHHDTISNS